MWGMPIVSVDAMRQAYFRDAGCKYNDVVFWSKPSDWKNQTPTPNTSTRYVYFNINTQVEGPVVLEIPAAVDAGLFGTVLNAWQVPMADVGPDGTDAGKGGKYLFLPPGFKSEVPDSYYAFPMKTYNGYGIFRAIPMTSSDQDVAKAIEMVKQLRLYPLSEAVNPPLMRFVDMEGKMFDGMARFDESFYASLARMVNEEPVQERDMTMMGLLLPTGIEKGKEFKPAAATQRVLAESIAEAHAWFMELMLTYRTPHWSESTWAIPGTMSSFGTAFSFQRPNFLDVDERGVDFFAFYAAPLKLGAASFYVGAFRDANGSRFRGENTYRLHVPPNVPAKQFWALTVYDCKSCGFILNMPRAGLDSFDQNMKRNADGSVDIYIGLKAPAGTEANSIPTAPGRAWFPLFRFYGPDKPLLDKTWKLPDIEEVK